MKTLSYLFLFLPALTGLSARAQDNTQQIRAIVQAYSQSVIRRDSAAFYALFNDDPVTWCAAMKDSSQKQETAKAGTPPKRSYSFSSHKAFMRGLFRYKTTEDKFDNVVITQDGTVASVAMDYSFLADGKMTNWGNKYLGLIKRNGQWKITSVIYSIELVGYYPQPALAERKKLRLVSQD